MAWAVLGYLLFECIAEETMPPRFVVLSDDLSGGMNIGVEFASHGLKTFLAQHGQPPTEADVFIVDTETRDASLDAAYEKTRQMAESTRANAPDIVVKKIDSLLRGSVWPEIDAVRTGYAFDRCLLVAASPKLNRTTLHGYHYVDGELLHEARRRVDPSSSVIESYVPTVLNAPSVELLDIDVIRQGRDDIHDWIQGTDAFLLVADCTDQDELNATVSAAYAAGIRFFAGTYGLGEALCRLGPPTARPILVVVGSLSLAAKQQVDYLARRENCVHVQIKYDSAFFERSVQQLADDYRTEIQSAVDGASCLIFRVSAEPDGVQAVWQQAASFGLDKAAVAEGIAVLTSAILEPMLAQFGGFVATGGSTANGLFQLLGADGLVLDATEVLPGTPGAKLVGGEFDGIPFIAKPGSQGGEDALALLVDYVRMTSSAFIEV